MTDLHTHILPGMDDGASDVAAALALLEQQWLQGVRNVALTSHYNCEAEDLNAFLERRDRAFRELSAAAPAEMELRSGCEVFFSPELLQLDVRSLCLQGTSYLLLELPILQKPAFLREVLLALRQRGIVPLIAHAERYLCVQKSPELLAEWIGHGALIQVNAGSVYGGNGAFVRKLIRWGLVHVLASDAHSVRFRPADLRRGLDTVGRRIGLEHAERLERNAQLIFSGEAVPETKIRMPKKFFGIRF